MGFFPGVFLARQIARTQPKAVENYWHRAAKSRGKCDTE